MAAAAPIVAGPGILTSAGTSGGPGGPIYDLRRGDIYTLHRPNLGIAVVTNHNMRRDRQGISKMDRRRWHELGNAGGVLRAFNGIVFPRRQRQLVWPGTTAITIGGSNPNHASVIMCNPPKMHRFSEQRNRHLRTTIHRCLERAFTGSMWLGPVTEIAFPLIGCGRFGYGYENAAEQALSTITEFFNDRVSGAARRAQITRVHLMIPTERRYNPSVIEQAWRKAWDRYIARLPPPAIPKSLQRLIQEGNTFTGSAELAVNPAPPLIASATGPPPAVSNNNHRRQLASGKIYGR